MTSRKLRSPCEYASRVGPAPTSIVLFVAQHDVRTGNRSPRYAIDDMHPEWISRLRLCGHRVCAAIGENKRSKPHCPGLDPRDTTSFFVPEDPSICNFQFVIGLSSNVTHCTPSLLMESSKLRVYSPGINETVNLRSVLGCPISIGMAVTPSVRVK